MLRVKVAMSAMKNTEVRVKDMVQEERSLKGPRLEGLVCFFFGIGLGKESLSKDDGSGEVRG